MIRNVYFINYKNSSIGTGGVGTTTRDILSDRPEFRFVFWDGSKIDREHDMSISVPESIHKRVHKMYSKLYLWPVLHGLGPKVSSKDLEPFRKLLDKQMNIIADALINVSQDKSGGSIYWVNDYTAISLVDKLRNHDKNSTIIYSFRTPFGADGVVPRIYQKDNHLMRGLFSADLITFHRVVDMQNFIEYSSSNFGSHLLGIKRSGKHRAYITLRSKHVVELFVIPEGNNRNYRKSLISSGEATKFKTDTLDRYKGMKVISGLSRFEETKGILYEVELIGEFIKNYPEWTEKFVFLRYTYLSKEKEDTTEYLDYFKSVRNKAEYINGKYGTDSWKPITLINQKLNDKEVAGLAAASDIFVIASIADGFNHLVSEVAFSQPSGSKTQLLLSNVGATDYFRGYWSLSHNLKKDSIVLARSLSCSITIKKTRLRLLKYTASRISTLTWYKGILREVEKKDN